MLTPDSRLTSRRAVTPFPPRRSNNVLIMFNSLFIINGNQHAAFDRAAGNRLRRDHFLHPGIEGVHTVLIGGGGHVILTARRAVGVHHVDDMAGILSGEDHHAHVFVHPAWRRLGKFALTRWQNARKAAKS